MGAAMMKLNIRSDYPLDLLPEEIREPVLAVSYLVQAPKEMCGQSVIAAVNFCIQEHVDVATTYGVRPVSEFFVTLGQSGERKSSVDRLVLAGVKAWQDSQFDDFEIRKAAAREALEAWEKGRKAAKKAASASVPAGKPKPVDRILADLADKERTQFDVIDEEVGDDLDPAGDKPMLPLFPQRLIDDPTVQGLTKMFKDGFPSLGMFNDEAGQFLGSFAMGKDNALHTGASLSKLWDGRGVERVRASDDLGVYRGRRLAMHLMLQPGIAADLLDNVMFQTQGLTARLLVAYPESTVGQRFHRRSAEEQRAERDALAAMERFTARTREILDAPCRTKEGDRQHLEPRAVGFSTQARELWLDWTDTVERECGPKGLLAPVVSLGNKAGEHVARLAATFAAFRDLQADLITQADMAAAIALMEYHLSQTLRLIGELPNETEESRDYEALEAWVREWPEPFICVSNMSAECRPKKLRGRKDQILKFVKQMLQLGILLPHDKPEVIKGKNRMNVFEITRD